MILNDLYFIDLFNHVIEVMILSLIKGALVYIIFKDYKFDKRKYIWWNIYSSIFNFLERYFVNFFFTNYT